MFFKSHYRKRIKTRSISSSGEDIGISHRQELLAGFDQGALERATINMIGGGGIGSEVGEGLVRKGVGYLKIFDHDFVELSNLNRQLFFKRDLYKSKAKRLARNLAPHATCGTLVEGYNLSFQDAVALGMDLHGTIAVCGVDNGRTRVDVSNYYRELKLPVLFIAVDYVAESGYVFLQEPGKACFGCLFPKSLRGHKARCFTPAVKDILKIVAGLALYAIDSLLMDRKRNWNYRRVHLAGFMPDDSQCIERLSSCPLCKHG